MPVAVFVKLQFVTVPVLMPSTVEPVVNMPPVGSRKRVPADPSPGDGDEGVGNGERERDEGDEEVDRFPVGGGGGDD